MNSDDLRKLAKESQPEPTSARQPGLEEAIQRLARLESIEEAPAAIKIAVEALKKYSRMDALGQLCDAATLPARPTADDRAYLRVLAAMLDAAESKPVEPAAWTLEGVRDVGRGLLSNISKPRPLISEGQRIDAAARHTSDWPNKARDCDWLKRKVNGESYGDIAKYPDGKDGEPDPAGEAETIKKAVQRTRRKLQGWL